jgi:hypothetical protein
MYIFKPKITIWVNFGLAGNGKNGIFYIFIRTFCIFYGHLAIWYIFPHFGILCQENSGNPAVHMNCLGLGLPDFS